MDLQRSTAIVTGAAHRVGKAIALSLARRGSDIIVLYGRSESKAKTTVKELQELGVEASAYSVDLQSPQEIASFYNEINETYSFNILVNSAASFVKKSLAETSLDDWDHAINTNTRAPFLMMKHAISTLETHDDALIVNIGDLSGQFAWRDFAAHGVSKAGLLHLTKIAARELAPVIRVNAIVPGPILPPPEMAETDPQWQEMINNIPLQKSGDPQQIGDTVVYFAQNDFVSGAIIPVDGGESLVGPKNH